MTAPAVTGRSRLCFVIGDPILQVRTPQALNALASARAIDALVLPLHVATPQFASVLGACRAMQNLNGLVVTLPHKVAAATLCDELTPRAELAGAVNVISRDADQRLKGDLVDGVGFVDALARAGVRTRDASVYLAGAGGVARAIAFALAEKGIARIGIANRGKDRAVDLIARLRRAFPDLEAHQAGREVTGFDLVINATSLGLRPQDDLPLEAASLAPTMFVADVVMQPPITRLLRIAAEIGCRTLAGQAMLDAQLELIAERLGLTAAV
jgi:shikimate dehydrogenase